MKEVDKKSQNVFISYYHTPKTLCFSVTIFNSSNETTEIHSKYKLLHLSE